MRLFVIVIAVGCGGGRDPANVQPTPAITPVAAVTNDAAVAPPVAVAEPLDAGSPEVPPPEVPALPAELANAPAWIYREFSTGQIRRDSTLTTFTLRRHTTRAMLTVDEQVARHPGLKSIGPWSARSTKLYVGTVEQRHPSVRLVLAHGSDTLDLTCKPGTLAVAGATAVRRPNPTKPGQEECGDRGRWVPGATRKLEALRCELVPQDEDPDRGERYAFVPAPGIEFLYVNDDCVIQGGGYRAIPKDGSIGAVR
jgi:hypothetical protein